MTRRTLQPNALVALDPPPVQKAAPLSKAAPLLKAAQPADLPFALAYGSEFFINLQLPPPSTGEKYAVVRLLPPRPFVHIFHTISPPPLVAST
jgi:hypothetical protein